MRSQFKSTYYIQKLPQPLANTSLFSQCIMHVCCMHESLFCTTWSVIAYAIFRTFLKVVVFEVYM